MNDDQLLRYARHLMLPDIEVAGQEALLAATVLVLGVGGLGSPVALYLAAAGVGALVLADDDVVELSNLQRQIAHGSADIGRSKPASAADRARGINPDLEVSCIETRLAGSALGEALEGCTLAVDCTDNAATRYDLNDACRNAGIPWVSAAAIRFEGQLTVFDPRRDDSPCYACLYPELPDIEARCAESGVIGPLVGALGSLQALEAIKVLTGAGTPLSAGC